MAAAPQWAPVKYTQTQLGGGATAQGQAIPGGLDLTTPSLRLQPGALRDCLNFEVAPFGGYSRVAGYERYDGRPSPSDASYSIVQVSAFTLVPTVGHIVTQAVSGATGTVVVVVTAPVPYLVLTKISGVFDTTHALSAI